MRLIDITGQTFGKWSVLARDTRPAKDARFICRCQCGVTKSVVGYSLRSGGSKSCKDCSYISKHGMSRTPEYHIWCDIKQRCRNPKEPNYKLYGARGIDMFDDWYDSFENFIADVGRRPQSDYQLDRINNDDDYKSGNVRWVSRKVNNNNRRDNVIIPGTNKTISQLVEDTNLPYSTLYSRLRTYNWSLERALTEPINIECRKKQLTVFGVER